MWRACLLAICVAACGGGGNSQTPTIDSPASTVATVTCPATPAATVMTSGFAYAPMMTSITQGQVVKFVMPSEHDVVPGHQPSDSALADPGLTVNFAETKCLMFTATGTFGFHCMPHGFNGTITVN